MGTSNRLCWGHSFWKSSCEKKKKVDAPSQLLPGCELVIVGMIVWGSGLIVMYHIMRVFTIGGGGGGRELWG